jgi:hypothetical protein
MTDDEYLERPRLTPEPRPVRPDVQLAGCGFTSNSSGQPMNNSTILSHRGITVYGQLRAIDDCMLALVEIIDGQCRLHDLRATSHRGGDLYEFKLTAPSMGMPSDEQQVIVELWVVSANTTLQLDKWRRTGEARFMYWQPTGIGILHRDTATVQWRESED